jgi:hypothetical protein
MINELFETMSKDMSITRYYNESDESFIYRLCYSALGYWCLAIANSRTGHEVGTTKHNQTITLNELLTRYSEQFLCIAERFIDSSGQPRAFSVFIRRIYEETGYLLTDENNCNRLAKFGRSIKFGNEALFFGLPSEIHSINGLGIFGIPTAYEVTINDFLIRDNLTCEQYFKARFDPIDFYERDIDIQELEFFDSLTKSVPSQSWSRNLETDCSVARKTEYGPYYRVMQTHDGVQFADEPVEAQSDNFTSYEYRRLYYTMKDHYENPLKIKVTKLDEEYAKIQTHGHLPNREYYFLLLLSWPERSAFDKTSFIVRHAFLDEVIAVLENIGLKA